MARVIILQWSFAITRQKSFVNFPRSVDIMSYINISETFRPLNKW